MLLKGLVQNHLSNGLATALGRLRSEVRILVLHRKSARKAKGLLGDSPLKLNCGSGTFLKPGWVNIDMEAKVAELQLDLREKLPFPDSSVSYIYSEHFFEHLEYPVETSTFLAESLRVLIPGGHFRVGVPDTEWPLIAYVREDHNYFRLARERWHPAYCDTKMHSINYHFRQGSQHKYAYDYETLAKLLAQAGFAQVQRSEFDPELDSEHRRIGTLYVSANK
jgi:predicted SAM-dependent methyltransferase